MFKDRPEQFYVPPHIRYAWVDDRVVILDLRKESYFAFDPIGSVMWREILHGQTWAERLRKLSSELSADLPRVECDLDALVDRCLEAGWLDRDRPILASTSVALPRRKPARHFLALKAWWTLLRVTRSLAGRGFGPTYGELSQATIPVAAPDSDSQAVLSMAVPAFARAEEFFYLKSAPADCLPRSLALFRFLREVGVPVEHCIGVQQFPFVAHAWAQYRGRIIHDDQENQSRYTVIARITG